MSDRQVQVQIIVPEAELGNAQELARKGGLDAQVQPKAQFVDPFSWILIGGAVIATTTFIRDLVERSKGGLVIDLSSSGSDRIRRNREVPSGWVVILSPDGKDVSIEVHDAPKDTIERLLSEIVSGGYKTAADIAKAARSVLPTDKVKD
jgi:hypothetical protein